MPSARASIRGAFLNARFIENGMKNGEFSSDVLTASGRALSFMGCLLVTGAMVARSGPPAYTSNEHAGENGPCCRGPRPGPVGLLQARAGGEERLRGRVEIARYVSADHSGRKRQIRAPQGRRQNHRHRAAAEVRRR